MQWPLSIGTLPRRDWANHKVKPVWILLKWSMDSELRFLPSHFQLLFASRPYLFELYRFHFVHRLRYHEVLERNCYSNEHDLIPQSQSEADGQCFLLEFHLLLQQDLSLCTCWDDSKIPFSYLIGIFLSVFCLILIPQFVLGFDSIIWFNYNQPFNLSLVSSTNKFSPGWLMVQLLSNTFYLLVVDQLLCLFWSEDETWFYKLYLLALIPKRLWEVSSYRLASQNFVDVKLNCWDSDI